MSKEFVSNWSSLPADEHIPLHDYSMALAIKMITNTHFGAYFKHNHNTSTFHQQYELVRDIKKKEIDFAVPESQSSALLSQNSRDIFILS